MSNGWNVECVVSVSQYVKWLGRQYIFATLVMPTVDAALSRLRDDDPVWEEGELVMAKKVRKQTTPWHEIKFQAIGKENEYIEKQIRRKNKLPVTHAVLRTVNW